MINSTIILYFWFKECNPNMWFKKNQEFDNLIKNKFQKTFEYCLKNNINNNSIFRENAELMEEYKEYLKKPVYGKPMGIKRPR